MDGVNYSKKSTPPDYKCGDCGATGVKLWREYQTFDPALRCCNCAAKSQGKDISDIDREGIHTSDLGKTDQIGWFVPAVPDEEGEGFWGYTSVPDAGARWWRRLPTKPR